MNHGQGAVAPGTGFKAEVPAGAPPKGMFFTNGQLMKPHQWTPNLHHAAFGGGRFAGLQQQGDHVFQKTGSGKWVGNEKIFHPEQYLASKKMEPEGWHGHFAKAAPGLSGMIEKHAPGMQKKGFGMMEHHGNRLWEERLAPIYKQHVAPNMEKYGSQFGDAMKNMHGIRRRDLDDEDELLDAHLARRSFDDDDDTLLDSHLDRRSWADEDDMMMEPGLARRSYDEDEDLMDPALTRRDPLFGMDKMFGGGGGGGGSKYPAIPNGQGMKAPMPDTTKLFHTGGSYNPMKWAPNNFHPAFQNPTKFAGDLHKTAMTHAGKYAGDANKYVQTNKGQWMDMAKKGGTQALNAAKKFRPIRRRDLADQNDELLAHLERRAAAEGNVAHANALYDLEHGY